MCRDSFNETENVASATECTGLMPALPPEDSDGAEHEARLYAVHALEQRRNRRKDQCTKREKTQP